VIDAKALYNKKGQKIMTGGLLLPWGKKGEKYFIISYRNLCGNTKNQ